jgi:hypothetical protein
MVLVEAKSHKAELSESGKVKAVRGDLDAQRRSDENHEYIGAAIASANRALNAVTPGTALSADRNYQLANRVAHAWWLANKGIPVVLVYLGFLKDATLGAAVNTFTDHADWLSHFRKHCEGTLPEGFAGRWISCGAASLYLLVRSLELPGG